MCLNNKNLLSMRAVFTSAHCTGENRETFFIMLGNTGFIHEVHLWIYFLAEKESVGGEQQTAGMGVMIVKLFQFVGFLTANCSVCIHYEEANFE